MRRTLIFTLFASFVLAAAGGNFAHAAQGAATSEKSAKNDTKKKDSASQLTTAKTYLTLDPIYTTIMEGDSVSGLLIR